MSHYAAFPYRCPLTVGHPFSGQPALALMAPGWSLGTPCKKPRGLRAVRIPDTAPWLPPHQTALWELSSCPPYLLSHTSPQDK